MENLKNLLQEHIKSSERILSEIEQKECKHMIIDVNMSFKELVENATGRTFLDVVKLLKLKYGVAYKNIAEGAGLNKVTLTSYLKGTRTYSEEKLELAAENLKRYFAR